jgi:riboflavin biosynthesis pyrimidine reductase
MLVHWLTVQQIYPGTVPADTVTADTVPADTVPADTGTAGTVPARTVPADTTELLGRLYGYPGGEPGRPWVRANMVASIDGAIEVAGRSSRLGGPADRSLFGVLRSLADVILVGAGTARAEHYGPANPAALVPALRAGRPATPPIAVLTGRLDLDPGSALLSRAPPDARTIVITGADAPADRQAATGRLAELITVEPGQLSAARAVAELGRRGYAHVLVEGGPGLLAQLAAAGRLDDLCLTISPGLVGGDSGRILSGGPPAGLPDAPVPFSLAHILTQDGFLFCRYQRAAAREGRA